jgi:hypothetical protein
MFVCAGLLVDAVDFLAMDAATKDGTIKHVMSRAHKTVRFSHQYAVEMRAQLTVPIAAERWLQL